MARAVFLRTCLFLVLAAQLGPVSSQVPSNYVPLDQLGRAAPVPNSVRSSTYQEGEQPIVRQSVRASTVQGNGDPETAQSEEEPDQENISNQPLDGVTATANGIEFPGSAIVALGSDPVRAYTAKNYPGIARGAIQRVKDTQAEYAESLASQDIVNILGRPFLQMAQGSGRCADGQSGAFSTYYYLIREGEAPKSMAVVRFCADGMQGITTQSLR